MPTQLKPAASCLLEFSLLCSFQFLQGNTDSFLKEVLGAHSKERQRWTSRSLNWASESFNDSWLCSPWRLHVVFQMSLAIFLKNCNKDKTWTKQASSTQSSIHQTARVVWECLLTWKKQWFVENLVTGTSCLFITPRVRFALTSFSYIMVMIMIIIIIITPSSLFSSLS